MTAVSFFQKRIHGALEGVKTGVGIVGTLGHHNRVRAPARAPWPCIACDQPSPVSCQGTCQGTPRRPLDPARVNLLALALEQDWRYGRMCPCPCHRLGVVMMAVSGPLALDRLAQEIRRCC